MKTPKSSAHYFVLGGCAVSFGPLMRWGLSGPVLGDLNKLCLHRTAQMHNYLTNINLNLILVSLLELKVYSSYLSLNVTMCPDNFNLHFADFLMLRLNSVLQMMKHLLGLLIHFIIDYLLYFKDQPLNL